MTNRVSFIPNKYFSVEKSTELGAAAKWAIKRLMPRQHNLNIHIVFEPLKGVYGTCEPIFWERNPKDFRISIRNNLSLKTSHRVLFHEMVHVKQYASNALRDSRNGTMWYKENHDDTPYHKQPWEIEALEMEKILLSEYWN